MVFWECLPPLLFRAYKKGEVQKEEIVNRNDKTDVSHCFNTFRNVIHPLIL